MFLRGFSTFLALTFGRASVDEWDHRVVPPRTLLPLAEWQRLLGFGRVSRFGSVPDWNPVYELPRLLDALPSSTDRSDSAQFQLPLAVSPRSRASVSAWLARSIQIMSVP